MLWLVLFGLICLWNSCAVACWWVSAGAMTNQEAVVLLAVKVTGGMSCRWQLVWWYIELIWRVAVFASKLCQKKKLCMMLPSNLYVPSVLVICVSVVLAVVWVEFDSLTMNHPENKKNCFVSWHSTSIIWSTFVFQFCILLEYSKTMYLLCMSS